jgi:hypothetical protein
MTSRLDSFEELDHRRSDGIDVRLVWHRHDGRVVVAVDDAKTGAAFAIDVRENDRAFDVFHHPFAYAAWRGVETGVAPPGELLAA